MVPSTLLLLWLSGLFSVALFGGGLWLVWEWYDNVLAGLPADRRLLVAGLVLLVLALLGRPLLAPFLGRAPREGEVEPHELPAGTVQKLERPDGSVLHVEFHGPADAPVLLFTHGWGLSSQEWFYARRALAERYRLISWDLPGLGGSTAPRDRRYSMERLADDLRAVLALAGERPVVLVGHSIGGMTMQTFCQRHPELLGQQVRGLILTHTTYTNPLRTAWGARLMAALERPLQRPLCWLTVALWPLVWLTHGLSYLNGGAHLMNHLAQFGGHETRGQLAFITRLGLRAHPAVVARGMLAMMDFEAAQVLSGIPVPTLVIAADRDKATLPAASAYLAQHIPHTELLALSPAGHLGLLEHAGEWTAAVSAFAGRCLKAGA